MDSRHARHCLWALSIWSPIVDTACGKAYLIASPPQAYDTVRLGLISVDLTNWTCTERRFVVYGPDLTAVSRRFVVYAPQRRQDSACLDSTIQAGTTNFSPTATYHHDNVPNSTTKIHELTLSQGRWCFNGRYPRQNDFRILPYQGRCRAALSQWTAH